MARKKRARRKCDSEDGPRQLQNSVAVVRHDINQRLCYPKSSYLTQTRPFYYYPVLRNRYFPVLRIDLEKCGKRRRCSGLTLAGDSASQKLSFDTNPTLLRFSVAEKSQFPNSPDGPRWQNGPIRQSVLRFPKSRSKKPVYILFPIVQGICDKIFSPIGAPSKFIFNFF